MLRVTLGQWRAFVATAQSGSFQGAANELNKTQSAIAYSIRKMEASLGQRLFDLNGRQARITQVGKMLLPRARGIIAEAEQAEQICTFKCIECLGGVGEIPIAVDVAFPIDVLLAAMRDLSALYPDLSIRIHETARTDAAGLLADGYVRIAIAKDFPQAIKTEPIMAVPFLCVASPSHPLCQRDTVAPSDLNEHLQIVVQDTPYHGSGCGGQKRWTISHFGSSLSLLRKGDGYAWMPRHVVQDDLDNGMLVVLPIDPDNGHDVHLSLGYRENEEDCEVILTFVSILRDLVSEWREAYALKRPQARCASGSTEAPNCCGSGGAP